MNENNQGNQDNSQSIFNAGLGQTVATPSSVPVEPTVTPVANPTENVQVAVNSMEQLGQTASMNNQMGNVQPNPAPINPVQTPTVNTPVEPVQTPMVNTPVEPVQTVNGQMNGKINSVQTPDVNGVTQDETLVNQTIKINEATGQVEKGETVTEASETSSDDEELIKDKKGTSRFVIILFIILIAFIIGLPTIVDLVKNIM